MIDSYSFFLRTNFIRLEPNMLCNIQVVKAARANLILCLIGSLLSVEAINEMFELIDHRRLTG
jgi:hypothetical protein